MHNHAKANPGPLADDGTVVLAGCGDLGVRVGLRLADRGRRVVGLRRHPEQLPDSITGSQVDLARETPRFPSDTSTVIVALTADERTEAAYRETFVVGLHHVLDAIDGLPGATPPRVLFVSSTSVYGVTDGSWVDEQTLAIPVTRTAWVLREAEDLLHARLESAIVLRFGGLYGSSPGPRSLVTSVRAGTAVVPSTVSYTNRIHRDDAAAAIEHLTMHVAEPECVYLGVDDEPVSRTEVLVFLADELGVGHPTTASEPPSGGRGKRCSNARLRASGFSFVYPTYREGYRAIIGEL